MTDRPAVRRLWIPGTVWALAAVGLAGLYLVEGYDLNRQNRVLAGWSVILFAVLVTTLWLLFFSGMRWFVRLGLFALVAAAGIGSVRGFDIQGDMVPIPVLRGTPTIAGGDV